MVTISLSMFLLAIALAGCASRIQPVIKSRELSVPAQKTLSPTGPNPITWNLIFRYPQDFPTNSQFWYLIYSTNLSSWDFYPQSKFVVNSSGLWVTNEFQRCFFRIEAVK